MIEIIGTDPLDPIDRFTVDGWHVELYQLVSGPLAFRAVLVAEGGARVLEQTLPVGIGAKDARAFIETELRRF